MDSFLVTLTSFSRSPGSYSYEKVFSAFIFWNNGQIWPNWHCYIIERTFYMIRLSWPWPNFQDNQSHLTLWKTIVCTISSKAVVRIWWNCHRYIIWRTLVTDLIYVTLNWFSRSWGSYNYQGRRCFILKTPSNFYKTHDQGVTGLTPTISMLLCSCARHFIHTEENDPTWLKKLWLGHILQLEKVTFTTTQLAI